MSGLLFEFYSEIPITNIPVFLIWITHCQYKQLQCLFYQLLYEDVNATSSTNFRRISQQEKTVTEFY